MAVATKNSRWMKVLYLKQDFEDNYVDESFLKDLRKNVRVTIVSLKDAVYGSLSVTQQICNTVSFAGLYLSLKIKLIDPSYLLIGTICITLFGYILFKLITIKANNSNTFARRTVMKDIQSVFIFVCCSYGVSPILKTLTSTISTDTIYATTTIMFIIHLLFHFYGLEASFVSGTVSLNAAIFGGICLASRLQNVFEVFTLVTLNISLFGLVPSFRNTLMEFEHKTQLYILCSLSAVATLVLMYYLYPAVLIPVIMSMLFINIICPLWFVKLQKYKENIHGPWDEAEIKEDFTHNDYIHTNSSNATTLSVIM